MKKKGLLSFLLAVIMLFSLCTVSFAACPNSPTVESPYGAVAYNYVKYLDQNLRERIAGSAQEQKAAAFIQGELESFGYEVTIQDFNYKRGNTTTYSQNLIVTKPGRSDKQIILGAHYDSVGTAGVDDNGSGTSVALETAMRMYGVDTPYTIVFIFFGAEETGLRGSKAYADTMTEEDIANTICMINIDSVLAGTYRYLYSGDAAKDAEGNTIVEKAWPFFQAKEIADLRGLDMHSNDTPLNYDYPSPSTGTWSDHQSFRNLGIPYLYAEAANWELPDYPNRPQYGSSGAYETESGEVMHVKGRDDLTFIENEWGDRAKNTLAAYATLMPEVLKRLDPAGLLADKAALESAYECAAMVDPGFYTVESAAALKNAVDNAKAVLYDDTITVEQQEIVDNAVAALDEAVDALESVAIVVGTETVDSAEADTVAVDVTYAGDVEITSVRGIIDSALPIASIESAYEYDYNAVDGSILVYDVEAIEGTLFTINYEFDWPADGSYAISFNVTDATDADGETINSKAVAGAVIVDNTYSAGDVSLNGDVTVEDVVELAKYLVNKVELSEKALVAADYSGNGIVNNADLIQIARSILAA